MKSHPVILWVTVGVLLGLSIFPAGAHPGNVIALMKVTPDKQSVLLTADLVFDQTGEPLLGATLTLRPARQSDSVTPEGSGSRLFQVGGGPNRKVISIDPPDGDATYWLHILSLGEETESTFIISVKSGQTVVSPEEILLEFPDVAVSRVMSLVIFLAVLLSMVLIIAWPSPEQKS